MEKQFIVQDLCLFVMSSCGQNHVPRANVKRQNPVSREMLVSQFLWVCPPLCAWENNLTGALRQGSCHVLRRFCFMFVIDFSHKSDKFNCRFELSSVLQWKGQTFGAGTSWPNGGHLM